MKTLFNGIALATFIAIISYFLGKFIPIGSVGVAIILGIIIGNLIPVKDSFSKGITFSEKQILSFSIALMGINLDFSILSSLGLRTVLIIIIGMIVTIYSAIIIGKWLGIDKKLALLIGIGNGVCGSSAIGAAAPILKADKASIGVSIAIVNLLGTVGIFLLPAVAHFLGFDSIDSGILVGNTLQAVGQVTAAGFAISDLSGVSATTVKMGRILLLTPVILILIYYFHKEKEADTSGVKFPLFILFFIVFAVLNSFGILGDTLEDIISKTSHFALMVAMAAVGLKIKFSEIKTTGTTSLKLAAYVFKVQILLTALLIAFI